MRTFLLSAILGFAVFPSQPANAQDASFYDCQNDRLKIAIAPMSLDKAIARFTSITRCPASIDTDQVKGRPTRTMKTMAVKGRLTPGQALAHMLRNTPLKSTPIHGGFSVSK
ncbi:STN domain-containing protein [Sphingomonas sp. RRHST34]|uniref:STN domain-containing protein n=1 Tax=Sphingomonas citri TaxID=2862499 RepID=A0ABS7BU86_9SPHN|nr:STN domain-containing protein [Sphingomonas citri]MBW6533146.1 STN domain-containing protein [Sphingomonas citri]